MKLKNEVFILIVIQLLSSSQEMETDGTDPPAVGVSGFGLANRSQ